MTLNAENFVFSVEVAAFFFGMVLLAGCIINRRSDAKAKWFHAFVVCAVLNNLLDALRHILSGSASDEALLLVNTLLHIVGFITYMVATNYQVQYAERMSKGITGFCLAVDALSLIMIILALFNIRYGFFFKVENHNILQGKLYYVTQVYAILVLLANMGLIAWNRVMDSKTRLTLLCYTAVPYVAVFIRLFTPLSLLSSGTMLAVFIIYVNLYTQQSRTLEETENTLLDTRVKLMMSQIQPHFLYNALSSISYLCTEDPAEAEKATNEFADYLRGNLKSINSEHPIPFEDELKHTETYLSIEKRRFPKKLNVWYNIKTTDFTIPALSIQPIAENAVRYGVESRFEPTLIIISSYEGDDEYVVKVSDDGGGFDVDAVFKDGKEHIGIIGVRNRLKKMSGGTLEINSVIGKGTEAVFHIPKNTSEGKK